MSCHEQCDLMLSDMSGSAGIQFWRLLPHAAGSCCFSKRNTTSVAYNYDITDERHRPVASPVKLPQEDLFHSTP